MKRFKPATILLTLLLMCSVFTSCNAGLTKVYVQTDSMEPFIERHSTVYVEKVAAEDIKIGDVIAFEQTVFMTTESDMAEAITIQKVHRVVDIDESGMSFITKGDNVDQANEAAVHYHNVIGRYVKHNKSILDRILYG